MHYILLRLPANFHKYRIFRSKYIHLVPYFTSTLYLHINNRKQYCISAYIMDECRMVFFARRFLSFGRKSKASLIYRSSVR